MVVHDKKSLAIGGVRRWRGMRVESFHFPANVSQASRNLRRDYFQSGISPRYWFWVNGCRSGNEIKFCTRCEFKFKELELISDESCESGDKLPQHRNRASSSVGVIFPNIKDEDKAQTLFYGYRKRNSWAGMRTCVVLCAAADDGSMIYILIAKTCCCGCLREAKNILEGICNLSLNLSWRTNFP